jgi:hypothetical protein
MIVFFIGISSANIPEYKESYIKESFFLVKELLCLFDISKYVSNSLLYDIFSQYGSPSPATLFIACTLKETHIF